MAERTLKVIVGADASKGIKELKKFEKQTGVLSKTAGAAFKGVKLAAKGIAVGLGVAAAGLVGATKKFGDFDAALTESVAIMGDVSEQMRGDMSDAAREIGKNTKFSAEQAAESFFFLASAGLDAKQSIEALPAVAAFAQAGNFDMALATDLATDAQSALGLASEDSAENLENLTRVSDVFVKANTLANASVEQFATSMTAKAGGALRSVGKDIEEGTATLAVFADQGIKGERAGTILRATLDGLSKNARENASAFEDAGIAVFDAEGNMRNMADITADLEGALEGMSTEQREAELSALGFNKRSKEGILALLGNSEALAEYEGELRNAGGTTEDVAANQMDSLNAQMGLLKDRVIDAGLTIGAELEPRVRDVVESFSAWISENGELIDSIADGIGGAIDKLVEWAGWIKDTFASNVEAGFSPMQAAIETAKDLASEVKKMLPSSVTSNVEGLAGGFALLLGPMALIAREVLPLIRPALDAIIPPLVELANTLVPIFAEGLSALVSNLLPGLVIMLEAVIGFLGENGGLVMALGIAGAAFKIFTAIMATNPFVLIATAVIAVAALIIGNWDSIVSFLSGVWDWITENVAKVGDWFKEQFDKALKFVKNIFLNFTGPGLLIKHFDDIRGAVTKVKNWITDKFDDAVEFLKKLPGRVTDAVGGLFSKVHELVTAAQEWVAEKLDEVVTFVTNLPGRIASAASGMWDGIKDAFRSALNWIIDKWNSLELKIGGATIFGGTPAEFTLPSATISTPNIPRFHQGGVVPGRPGEERLILAEPGETIIPANQSTVVEQHFHFENHGTLVGVDVVDAWLQNSLVRARRRGVAV